MFEPRICSDHAALCRDAAEAGAVAIRAAIATRGEATIVLATGASQFGTLAALTAAPQEPDGCSRCGSVLILVGEIGAIGQAALGDIGIAMADGSL